jgi:uncharacterized protein
MCTKWNARYSYHNLTHTLLVVKAVDIIGRHEKCNKKELELLQIAAWWHDIGFLVQPDKHEQTGCIMVKEKFPAWGFTEEEISDVCKMIMATCLPQTPDSLLEKIICDADLFYLGTSLSHEFSDKLSQEWFSLGIIQSHEQFLTKQHDFVATHTYFTSYGKGILEPQKKIHYKL